MSSEAAKRLLRQEMRELRRRVAPALRAAVGQAVARHVLAFEELRPARRVVLYSALPDEVPTDGLLRELLRRGHPILLPRAATLRRLRGSRRPGPGPLRSPRARPFRGAAAPFTGGSDPGSGRGLRREGGEAWSRWWLVRSLSSQRSQQPLRHRVPVPARARRPAHQIGCRGSGSLHGTRSTTLQPRR
jgi:hypothetical protein